MSVLTSSEVEILIRLSLELAELAESRVQTLEEMKKIMDLRTVAARVGAILKEEEGKRRD